MTTQPIFIEDSTISVVGIADGVFQDKPNDLRFDRVNYSPFNCRYSVRGSSTVEFRLPALTDNHVYLIQDNIIEVQCRLVGTEGKILPADKIVVLANNSTDTLFSRVSLTLGNQRIDKSDSNYPIKSYLNRLLSFPSTSKSTWMTTECWAEDRTGAFDPKKFSSDCPGTMIRLAYLKKRGPSIFWPV